MGLEERLRNEKFSLAGEIAFSGISAVLFGLSAYNFLIGDLSSALDYVAYGLGTGITADIFSYFAKKYKTH